MDSASVLLEVHFILENLVAKPLTLCFLMVMDLATVIIEKCITLENLAAKSCSIQLPFDHGFALCAYYG